ncbi:MAG: hypothetical protein AAGI24_05150 [Pseudomonadota bacterium]
MRSGLLPMLGLLACSAAQHAIADNISGAALPGWRELVYEQRSFWASARSTLTLDECAKEPGWCTVIRSEVGDNREEISLRTDRAGMLQTRERFSQGRDQRKKLWSYTARAVHRQRFEPASDEQASSNGWQQTSDRLINYPDDITGVTDAHLLLALAAADRERQFLVHTDMNFYRVTLTPAGEDLIKLSESLTLPGPSHREVDLVALTATLVGEARDKPDFALLGLSGALHIALDRETGLPLQIHGRAPRLGQITINLARATLRQPALRQPELRQPVLRQPELRQHAP